MSKQVATKGETVVTDRTPQIIAVEIRSIDIQTREFVMRSVIEIGKKLTEAKALVAHGEWGKWLETNVDYSQSTANNFMRIADEYAVNSQAFGNLSYTQAVALLGMSSEDKEAFVEAHDMESMSTRELQKAVKEKQELERQLQEEQERVKAEQVAREEEKGQREVLHNKYQRELELRQKLENELAAAQAEAAKDGTDKADPKLKVELRKAEKSVAESKKRISELETEMESKIKTREDELNAEMAKTLTRREQELSEQAKLREEAAEKQLADMQEQLRKNNNVSAIKVKVHFEALVGTFKELLNSVSELENEEQKKAIQGRIATLCDEMKGFAV